MEDEMIKIGIIGAGRIGKVHLQSITYHVKNACVKAVADPFMNEETEKFIRDLGVQKVCKDYKEILEDSEIDAVFGMLLYWTPMRPFPSRPLRPESMCSARSPWTIPWPNPGGGGRFGRPSRLQVPGGI